MRESPAVRATSASRGCLVFTLVLLSFLPVRAADEATLIAKPESGGKFRYSCELRNEGAQPLEILAFNTFVEAPWRFEYRDKWLPRVGEGKTRKTVPYLIIEATSVSKGKMLLILPEEKGTSRVPPRNSPENFYFIASGGSAAFHVDFPERPSRVVLTYFIRNEFGELKRCRLASQFP